MEQCILVNLETLQMLKDHCVDYERSENRIVPGLLASLSYGMQVFSNEGVKRNVVEVYPSYELLLARVAQLNEEAAAKAASL